MIPLTENFLRENVHSEIFDEFPFLLAETVPPEVCFDKKFREFEILYKLIFDEFGKTQGGHFVPGLKAPFPPYGRNRAVSAEGGVGLAEETLADQIHVDVVGN
jgi:hypothetical protein